MKELLSVIWLCLCLSLLTGLQAAAQQPIEVEVKVGGGAGKLKQAEQLNRWQAGLEISRPVTFNAGLIRDWKSSIPLEAVLQYRLLNLPVYAQLYGGYFKGSLKYDNGSELEQSAFYFKPGVMWVASNKDIRHQITLETNLIFSKGELKGKHTLKGRVFGDYEASAREAVDGFGVEAGIGSDLVRLGDFKLKGQFRMYIAGASDYNLEYVPGAGYTGIIGFGYGINLYLLHAWGKL